MRNPSTDQMCLVELHTPPTFEEILDAHQPRRSLTPSASITTVSGSESTASDQADRTGIVAPVDGLEYLRKYFASASAERDSATDQPESGPTTTGAAIDGVIAAGGVATELSETAEDDDESTRLRDLIAGIDHDAADETSERMLMIIKEMRSTAYKIALAHDFSPIARRRLLVLLTEMEDMVALEDSA